MKVEEERTHAADWRSAMGRSLLQYLERRALPVVVLDGAGVVRWLNPRARSLLSLAPEQPLACEAAVALPEVSRSEFLEWQRAWREGRESRGRLLLPLPSARTVPYWALGQPLVDAGGTLTCVVLELYDERMVGETIARSARHARQIVDEVLGGLAAQAADATEALASGPSFATLRANVPALAALSAREWEVASRIAGGDRVSQVAEGLGVRVGTVRNHLKAVFRKLGVASQRDLVERFRGWRAERLGHS